MHSSTSSSDNSQTHLRGLRILGLMLAVIALLIGAATEVLLRTQVSTQDNRPGHLKLLANTDHVDAAFGDSHVARGFDARDGFVNLAYPSENIEDMILKVDHFYKGRTAGRVIVQADPHLFAPYRLAARPANLTPSTPRLLLVTKQYRPQLLAFWGVFFRNFGRLQSSVVQTASGALLSSGDLSLDTERLQMREARSRLRLHTVAPDGLVKPAQDRYRLLLNTLVAKRANVCLVSYPVSPAYKLARDDTTLRKVPSGHTEAMAFFASEAARLEIVHWDARAHVTDTGLFRDVDHLNSAGAQKVASEFISRCFGAAE